MQTTLTKETLVYEATHAAAYLRGRTDDVSNNRFVANLLEALAAQIAEAQADRKAVFDALGLVEGAELSYGCVTFQWALRCLEVLKRQKSEAEAAAASARETVEKHRHHVELSPGVGVEVASYALRVCDDILNDLKSTPAPVTPSAPTEADGWRFDMENAPRDEFISLWCPEDKSRWHASWQDGRWHGVDEHGLTRTDGYHVGSGRVTGWLITAWRPLPSPPTAREGK